MPDLIVRFVVELRCLLCARLVGFLDTPSWPWVGPAPFRRPGQTRYALVAEWWHLRCAACGGNVCADEVGARRVYPRVSWDDLEQPRRGRPPKWLVAERQQQAVADRIAEDAP